MKLDLQVAQLLAADLAGANVDVNEAQKALAYMLTQEKPRQFFDYLRTINRHGYTVVRSNRTIGYYRDLQAACERHLDGMEIDEMRQTLGWALRLLRYYKAVPDAEPDRYEAPAERSRGPAKQTSQTATQPDNTAASAELPRPETSNTPKGIVVVVPTDGEPGIIEGTVLALRNYRFLPEDVVGEMPTEGQQVRFIADQRKYKRKGDKKAKQTAWAVQVEIDPAASS
jgi:hypothetical protein